MGWGVNKGQTKTLLDTLYIIVLTKSRRNVSFFFLMSHLVLFPVLSFLSFVFRFFLSFNVSGLLACVRMLCLSHPARWDGIALHCIACLFL